LRNNRRSRFTSSIKGADKVGADFVNALKAQLKSSSEYALYTPGGKSSQGPDFSLELVTFDVPGRGQSAISVVVESTLPARQGPSYKWYHKAFLVDHKTVDRMARTLLADIDARWCRTIKNAPHTCPKELLP